MNLPMQPRRPDAGFALSQVVAVLIIVGLLAGIAIPLFLDQRKKGHDARAKADVTAISGAIGVYLDTHSQLPVIAVTGSNVTADGEIIGTLSPAVVLGPLVGSGTTTWCIDVKNDHGDRAKVKGYKFSAAADKVEEGQCA